MTAKLLYKFINVETMEEDFRKVSSAPENWVAGGQLSWPPPKDLNSKKKKQASPEEGWTVFDCKILGEPFATLKEALAREKLYEQFSNSESDKEHWKRKQLRRKHPVTVDLIDANQLFDTVQATGTKSQRDVNISLDPILPAELLDGLYLGENTDLSIIVEAIGSTVSSEECKVKSNDIELNLDHRSNEHPVQAMDYQTQLNQYTVKPSQYNGPPSQYNGPPSQYSGPPSQCSGQLSQYNCPPSQYNGQLSQNNGQPSQYNGEPIQTNQHNVPSKHYFTHPREYFAYSNQQSFQSNQYPAQSCQYPFESNDVAVRSTRMQDVDKGKVVVLEQYTLGSSEYSCPIKNTRDTVQAIKSKNERIGKKKTIQINKGKIKKGKENVFKAKAAKMVDGKVKSQELKKGRQFLKKKNVLESNQSTSTLKHSIKSFRESEKIRSQPSTSCMSQNVDNYVPSPDHTMPNNLSHYLPLIYKELLEIKSMCKSNQVENNRNTEEIKKICEKMASTMEEDDPFAGGSVETFNAQFPMKKRSKLKSFYNEIIDDCSIEKKLAFRFRSIGGAKPKVMVRECMKYFVCDSLLKRYTWKGTKKKPGFTNFTRICKTLYSSVKRVFRKYTESKFSRYMSDYIKQANNRYKRKMERHNGEHESDGSDDSDDNENESEEEDGKYSGEDDSHEDLEEDGEDDSDDEEDDGDE